MIYIGVIGGASCSEKVRRIAWEAGKEIAHRGAVLVCGGGGGVMEEAARGAREHGGTVIGILPGEGRREASPYLSYSIVTGMGEGRNIIIVRSSHGLLAVDGEFGTLSEIALALRLGRPVVGIQTWELMLNGAPVSPLTYAADASTGVEMLFKMLDKG